jgi:hypothetical protein
MTVGAQPLNPPGTEIVDQGGRPNPMFARWLNYAKNYLSDVTSIGVTNPATVPWQNFANDAAAAAGGIGIGQQYRNGSVLMVRVV